LPDGQASNAMLNIADLYEEFERGLSRYAGSLARDSDKANDLVSETFLQAMAHLPLLEQLNTYQRKAWLYRVLKNRFIDQRRAERRAQNLVERLAWMNELAIPAALGQDVFAQVPAQYRELLHLHYVLEMTSEEIGLKLGVPAATVRSRLRLAIKWLRAHSSKFDR
jgi:RNA polymerase sigma-70 factor (ECF subfamily)